MLSEAIVKFLCLILATGIPLLNQSLVQLLTLLVGFGECLGRIALHTEPDELSQSHVAEEEENNQGNDDSKVTPQLALVVLERLGDVLGAIHQTATGVRSGKSADLVVDVVVSFSGGDQGVVRASHFDPGELVLHQRAKGQPQHIDPVDPSQPHLLNAVLDQIARGGYKERNSNDSKLDSVVKVGTGAGNASEEESHAKVSDYDHEVECEERPGVAEQIRHEVNNDGEDQNFRRREAGVHSKLAEPESRGSVEGVRSVLVHNGSPNHGASQFREGLEGVEEQGNEQKTTLAEGAGGGLTEVEIEGTEDDGDDDASNPGERQVEAVLDLERELTLHESPHLQVEANLINRLVRRHSLAFLDGNLKIVVGTLLKVESGLVLFHLSIQSLLDVRLVECFQQGLGGNHLTGLADTAEVIQNGRLNGFLAESKQVDHRGDNVEKVDERIWEGLDVVGETTIAPHIHTNVLGADSSLVAGVEVSAQGSFEIKDGARIRGLLAALFRVNGFVAAALTAGSRYAGELPLQFLKVSLCLLY
ncbi:unnamed protein product [Clonostachys rosea f. rosea IK726]|uniref:Uncharacterized protein n=1 Tax=Clonostachys rosea f. rosea IK726 TaxID=1349383 RepID=A0ACA9TRP5_BIOOC|nr:unnamed protein product [Clonostachys rosea f. rosea IK726]